MFPSEFGGSRISSTISYLDSPPGLWCWRTATTDQPPAASRPTPQVRIETLGRGS